MAYDCTLSPSKGVGSSVSGYPQIRRSLFTRAGLVATIEVCGRVYILKCADDSFYVGSARDLDT